MFGNSQASARSRHNARSRHSAHSARSVRKVEKDYSEELEEKPINTFINVSKMEEPETARKPH